MDRVKQALYIAGTLLLFFFAIDLMISSLAYTGRDTVQNLIQSIANPFTGLSAGLVITAMIQSSSTTTSLAVALVASGSLTIQHAVPVIMGANIGTTITSAVVSLGFINKKKELKRAVSAASYHCFFNLLTVTILFPLEYTYGFLSSVSEYVSNYFFASSGAKALSGSANFVSFFDPVISILVDYISNGYILVFISFVLLVTSILVFRKLISDLLMAKSPEAFSRFVFNSSIKSFFWGLITTAAIRSSTITTSVVVPIVARRIIRLRQAASFIMGANIGTTITAFIAASLKVNTDAVSIAIAHFLVNGIGVLIFFPVPAIGEIPLELARRMGLLTLKYRYAGFVFILITFFFLPFLLLYLSQE